MPAPWNGSPQVGGLAFDFDRAVMLHERGLLGEAESAYAKILVAYPNRTEALNLLGVLHIQTGRSVSGFELIDRALRIRPDFIDAHFNRGIAAIQLGRFGEALSSFDALLQFQSDHLHAHYNRGVALSNLDRTSEALASFDHVLGLQPGHADALLNRGVALQGLGDVEGALAAFDHLLEHSPGHVGALLNRGILLLTLHRLHDALESFDALLRISPDDVTAHFNRGNVLKDLGRLVEASECFERVLSLSPGHLEALINYGAALKMLGRSADALAVAEKALARQPDSVGALSNRGAALAGLLRLDEAVEAYDQALRIEPDNAQVAFNKSLALLLAGRFQEGWPLYERREAAFGAHSALQAEAGERRSGVAHISGKTLFVSAEQGFGDTIQFCRYVSRAADVAVDVTFAVQEELQTLLAGFDARVTVTSICSPPAERDLRIPLLSLPSALGRLTPEPGEPAYLVADQARAAAWSKRLGPRLRARIGLAWAGRASHENDYNRSIPFSTIAALFSSDWDWISLQKEARDGDRISRADYALLADVSDGLTDFAETAALISNLDLVVTVDTSVAHLSAALGKETWIMLPHAPDWRWLLGRDDSPWYPTVRLFRQPEAGAWAAVIAEVQNALRERFGP